MKMSKENYDKFMSFVNYTVENATDMEITYIMSAIVTAAKIAQKNIDKANKKKG